ncbi:hypothetical protein DPMN_001471 [Dreissena polymorpha]|uniref:Uncharacterized protein n=1 Tax=Dreissena polymorpha TaxID=45954 RepID=A0A9D4MJW0_DREPO|nr:hypothetical protein DPMN_001471 [Dreissena polymorpha]
MSISVIRKTLASPRVTKEDLADTWPTENESSIIEMLVANDYYLDFKESSYILVCLYLDLSKVGC